MKKPIVRLSSLQLTNIKNVKKGHYIYAEYCKQNFISR